MYRIGELEEQLVKRSEAAILLEKQKKEQEEKIRQLEASKAQVEQALQAQQKVTISAIKQESKGIPASVWQDNG